MKKYMKKKEGVRRTLRFSAVFLVLALILGTLPFVPAVVAKTKYETLHYDKVLKTRQDFLSGNLKNVHLKEATDGLELSAADASGGEYVTPIVEVPFNADFVGVHWKGSETDEESLEVFVRSSVDGETFSEWTLVPIDIDEGKNGPRADEIFGSLIGIGGSSFAQVRVDFLPGQKTSPRVKSLSFTFLNSSEDSKKTVQTLSFLSRSAAVADSVGSVQKTSVHGKTISIIPREAWGADESYRLNSDGSESWPRSYHGTRKLVFHHTAVKSSNGQTDLATNEATLRSMYYYQAVTQGWGDIGYNALVDAAGNIYEGRYGTHGDSWTRSNPTSDDIMVLDTEGGHAASYNSGSFGVSAFGDFTKYSVPSAQLSGLEDVLTYVADERGINVEGNSDFLNYSNQWFPALNNMLAHRDVNATACPGNRLYDQMDTIKSAVNSFLPHNLSGFSAIENGSNISGTSIGSGVIRFGWDAFSGATQYQYVLERVHGVTGSLSDNEDWQTAWLTNNAATAVTTNTDVQIDADTLQLNSNYVFYVRALDDVGNPISTVSHVNFWRNDTIGPVVDTESPVVSITSPQDGAIVSGNVSIVVSAIDNMGVTETKLSIDGTQVASSSTGDLDYIWDTGSESAGSAHTISATAYDAIGNSAEASISVTIASTSGKNNHGGGGNPHGK